MAEGNKFTIIGVVGQDGVELVFKSRNNVLLSKVLREYCERKGYNYDHVRFVFDGKRVSKDDTPASLGMKDGDNISAMMQMSGGGRHL